MLLSAKQPFQAGKVASKCSKRLLPGVTRPIFCVQHSHVHSLQHVKVVAASNHHLREQLSALDHELNVKSQQQATSWLAKVASQASRMLAVIGVAMALALTNVNSALAAKSGGRVGGTGGFRASAAARSASYSSPTSSASSYSSSRPTVVHHHTTVVSAGPSFGFGWGVPMWSPFGWGTPVYAGSSFSMMNRLFMIMLLAMVAFVAIRAFTSSRSQASEDEDELEDVPPVTVTRLQIGLLGVARGLKAQLDSLGARADTSSPEGLHLVLQETVLALLRNPHYCVSAFSSSQTLADPDAAERAYGSLALEERARIRTETLSNVGGGPVSRATVADHKEVSEMMVVTLIVAAEGKFALPTVKTAEDLKQALTKLGSITPNQIMAVELLWTPQADNDSLTQQEVMIDYPALMPICASSGAPYAWMKVVAEAAVEGP